jgi:1,2-diacylglycerol 3-alpha-glucosyltransferase
MKIVFTHTDFRVYWPGRLKKLKDYLSGKGYEFHVIEIAGAGSPYDFYNQNRDSLSWWYCLFPGKRMEDIPSGTANKSLIKFLDQIQPDIVFSGAIAFPSGAASVKWALKNNKKCVIFDNARLNDVPRNFIINYIKKKIYSGVDAIFCPAPEWNETYNFFGINSGSIFYGLNVVDNSYWSENTEPKPDSLPERYFLAVGRQILKKNFLMLLRAYYAYTREVEDPAHLVLIGNGPRRSVLEHYRKEKKLDRVIFLQFTDQTSLRPIYKNALAFILPSRYGETWGLVINEAMASGLPVMVSNQAGCSSTLVEEGKNGFTFSPFDDLPLSMHLLNISEMPEDKRLQMSARSKEIISNWDYNRFCRGVKEAIDYVCVSEKKDPDIIGDLLIKMWKGRYRPL